MISPTSSPPSLDGNPAANAKLPSSGFRWRPWKTGVVAGAGTLFLILVCITWRIFRRKTNVKDPESSNKGINYFRIFLVLSSHSVDQMLLFITV